MKKITNQERKAIREELAREFPGDVMMQDLHLLRRIHQLETEEMNLEEKIEYFRRKADKVSSDSTTIKTR